MVDWEKNICVNSLIQLYNIRKIHTNILDIYTSSSLINILNVSVYIEFVSYED